MFKRGTAWSSNCLLKRLGKRYYSFCYNNEVMNINDQTDTFQYELAKLVYRFKSEYDLNDYTIAGCLDFCKLSVLTETDDVIFTGELTTEDTDEEDTEDDPDIYPSF